MTENSIENVAVIRKYNLMMNRDSFDSMPFNPITHKFHSNNPESAVKEARNKKTSWKNRNFLKVKINDMGGNVYNDSHVPPAIKYMTSQDIKAKNIDSAYNPIKYEGNQFELPTRYRKRPDPDANHS